VNQLQTLLTDDEDVKTEVKDLSVGSVWEKSDAVKAATESKMSPYSRLILNSVQNYTYKT